MLYTGNFILCTVNCIFYFVHICSTVCRVTLWEEVEEGNYVTEWHAVEYCTLQLSVMHTTTECNAHYNLV